MHRAQDPTPRHPLSNTNTHASTPVSHTLCTPKPFTQAHNCLIFPHRHSLASSLNLYAALRSIPACAALHACPPLACQSPACSARFLYHTVHHHVLRTALHTYLLSFSCIVPRLVRSTSALVRVPHASHSICQSVLYTVHSSFHRTHRSLFFSEHFNSHLLSSPPQMYFFVKIFLLECDLCSSSCKFIL
jgi:hypothetical protein